MKKTIFYSILVVILFSCGKDNTHTPVIKPIPASDTIRPKIIIAENVQGCKLIATGSPEQPVDSLIQDSIFTVYKFLPTDPAYVTTTLYFTTNLPASRIISANWLIGNETTQRSGSFLSVDFDKPSTSLTVRLIINWKYANDVISFTDTLYKNFRLTTDTFLFGKYFGANIDGPDNKYTVTIGSMIDSSYNPASKIWGIQNLMIGYPYKLEISQKSRGFGICSAIGQKYLVQIGDRKYSFPFTTGYLNATRDSIVIDYSYFRVDPLTTFYDTFFVKKFIGKRL